MKKRMFLSTILMTLVLLVALTTATFAWYTASTADDATLEGVQNVAIATSDAEYSVGAGTIKVSLSDVTEQVGPTNQAGEIKYLINGVPTLVTPNGTYLTKGTVKWTVSFVGADASVDDKTELMKYAGDYTLVISGDGARLHADADSVIAAADASVVTIKITVQADGTFKVSEGTVSFAINSNVTESTAVKLSASLAKGFTEGE